MAYKAIFIDMDDTFINDELTIPPGNKKAVKELMENGKMAVICTGRGIFSVKGISKEIELDKNNGYIISHNGGTLYRAADLSIIKEKLFSSDDCMPVFKAAHKFNADIQAYRNDSFYIEKITERTKWYIDNLKPDVTMVENIENQNAEYAKVLINGEHDVLQKIVDSVKDEVGEKLKFFFSKPNYLEFVAPSAGKGETMEELCQMLGIDLKDVVAIGDSFNDISMIQKAGLGIAVKNADDEVKKHADYITQNDNNNGAVEEAIYRFLI